MSQDRRWSLLALEFKLFAVRHPEVKARLAAMNRRLVGSQSASLQDIMEASGRNFRPRPAPSRISLSAATNALALEHMLDRSIMPESELKILLANYFDSLTSGRVRTAARNGKKSSQS